MFKLFLIKNKIEQEGETPELLCSLAKYYCEKKSYEKSLEFAAQAINNDEKYSEAYLRKGIALYYMNNISEALKTLLQALELKNKSKDLYIILARIFLEGKKYKKALYFAEKIFNYDNKDNVAFYLKGSAEYYLGDKSAIQTLLTADKLGCRCENMYYHIIDIYRRKKDYTTALKYAEKLIRTNKKSSDALYIKGIILFDLNKYEEAMKYLSEAEEKGCSHYLMFYCLSYIYGAVGKQYEDAVDYANKAILKNPNNDFPYYLKGCFLYKMKEYKKAKEPLLKAEELGNKSKDLLPKLLYIFGLEKDYNKTLEYADKVLLQNPDNDIVYYKKGWAYYNLKDFKNAKEFLLKAEEAGNRSGDMFSILSYIFSKEEDFKKSLEYADKALARKPKSGYFHYRKGRALHNLKVVENAKNSFLTSESLGYKSCDMFSKLAQIFASEDNFSKSLEYASKAVFINSKNGFALYLKGRAMYKMQDYERAKTALLKAEEAGFKNDDLYSNLSYICSLEKDNEKSLAYAEMAILNNSDNNIPYYRKGWALYNMGMFEGAEKSFLKAEELGCEIDNMYALLACMYYIESDFKQSLKYIDKAIAKNGACKEYYFVKAQNLMNLDRQEEAEETYQKGNELVAACV